MGQRKPRRNANIVHDCTYHAVWATKYRRSVITPEVERRFKEVALETCTEIGAEILEFETMPDHVHLLLKVDPQFGIAKAIKRIKGRTSHHLRAEFPHLRSRIPTLWTNSYFVATTGGASIETIKRYIENQKNV